MLQVDYFERNLVEPEDMLVLLCLTSYKCGGKMPHKPKETTDDVIFKWTVALLGVPTESVYAAFERYWDTQPGDRFPEVKDIAVLARRSLPYMQYLRLPWWRHIRQTAIDAAGGRCQLCNAAGELHVHHRTYDRLGNEDLSDLTVLCKHCHAKFHDKPC